MKFLKAFLILACLSPSFAFAAESTEKPLPLQQQKQVLNLVKSNAAVRGALAEARRWAGATKCDQLQVEESTENSFEVYATCTSPEDGSTATYNGEPVGVDTSSAAQIHISGVIYAGKRKNSPVTIQINKIEFAYAG